MARNEKPQWQELSLFDDASFEEPTAEEREKAKEPTSESAVEATTPEKSRSNIVEEKVRLRGKKSRLKVTFPDGTVFCDVSATVTMILAISKIGVEKVASLGMEVCHVPLVNTEIVPRYAEWTKPISEGWYLMAQSDTKQKYMQMKSIVMQLELDVLVEMAYFDTMTAEGNERKRDKYKKKSKLCVTFPDGFVVCDIDHQRVMAEAVVRIGVDKVRKTNLRIADKPIVTSEKKYSSQVRLLSGEWLTVPPQIKDKYKILRVLSSMTHTPFDVKILS